MLLWKSEKFYFFYYKAIEFFLDYFRYTFEANHFSDLSKIRVI